MKRTINIVMKEDKSIDILLEKDLKKNITAQDRKINAKEIYESLKYEYGDTYVIKSDNSIGKDIPVFNAIAKLYQDIISEINQLVDEKAKTE